MIGRKLALLLGVFALSLAPAFAQKEVKMPPDLPPYGPLKPAQPPNVKAAKLTNGMTVWLVSQPGVPKVAVVLIVRGGMAADPTNLPGLSELLTNAVTEGTKTRSAKQIAEEMQAAGGDLNGNSEADSLSLSTNVLAEKAASGLAILADVVQNAAFPDDEVALAKRNLSDSLRAREAEPRFLASRAFAKAMFGDHPYSVIAPTQDSVAHATAADLRSEFGRRFRPDQALLVVAGDIDTEKMNSAIEHLFGSWYAPSAPPVPNTPAPPSASPHAVFLVPRPGSVQTTLVLGAFGPTRSAPDYDALEVASATYGGMFGSRLVNNIREDKGYTYSPGASLRTYRQAGVLETRADVRNPVTGASFNEINYELNRMVTTSLTDDELAHAKLYLVGLQAIELQQRDEVARELAGLWVDGLPPEELGIRSKKIEKMTAAEVDAAAKKYFAASRTTIVAVGEEKIVRDELAPFGLELKPAP